MSDDAAATSQYSQYSQSAAWYDRIYAAIGKDYTAEAQVVDGIIRARCPGASSLLDVGCGTGMHLEQCAQLYDETWGLDLDEGFSACARARCHGSTVRIGDMRSFALGRTFDAVTCMFSAVGHVGGVDALRDAVASMAAHLNPGGVLVIEPWFAPEVWRDGHYGVEVSEAPESTLVRVNHSTSDGNVSVVHFAWTEVSRSGIVRVDETLRLTRFTAGEYLAAFEAAGLSATFDEIGCNVGGRGLWIGVR